MQKFYAFRFYLEKKLLLQEMVGGGERKGEGGWRPPCPPFSTALFIDIHFLVHDPTSISVLRFLLFLLILALSLKYISFSSKKRHSKISTNSKNTSVNLIEKKF